MASATLDTNDLGATAAPISISSGTKMTLYVFSKTGTDINHRIGIEISPDGGSSWILLPNNILGVGCISVDHVATNARVKVLKAEGSTSTTTVHLIAR